MKKCLTRMVSDARLLIPAGLCVLCALSFLFAWIVHDNWSIRHEQYKTEGMQRTLTGLTEQVEVRQRVRGIRGAVDQVTFTVTEISAQSSHGSSVTSPAATDEAKSYQSSAV